MRCDELINCDLIGLAGLISELTMQDVLGTQVEQGILGLVDNPNDPISEAMRSRLKGWIGKIGANVANEYEMLAAKDRVARFVKIIEQPEAKIRQIHYEVKALREAVQDGIKNQLVYRYPRAKGDILKSWQIDWEIVIIAFPDTATDIRSGVDIWALGHYTASVFHMMRVLEYGLGALASSVNLKFDTQNWQNIISEIEKAIKQEERSLARGRARQERLRFLSAAAKEFTYFKDGWRNYVSHNKCAYDEYQARSVMEHTRDFMHLLSSNLPSDDSKKST